MGYTAKFRDRPGQTIQVLDGGSVLVDDYVMVPDNSPGYEYANEMVFEAEGQAALLKALALPADTGGEALVDALIERFTSARSLRAFADAQGAPYMFKVNFWP